MNALTEHSLLPAWTDSVHAAQATFRSVLKALSEPGQLQTLSAAITGPSPLHPATTALCLALLDLETPVWCDDAAQTAAVASYLRFHCGSPLSDDPAASAFAVIADASCLQLNRFAQGTMEYPDRSATLLIQVPTLIDGPARVLSGPGIAETTTLRVGGLPEDFDAHWGANAAAFPIGVDILFCCGNEIIGLPRTTRINGNGFIVEHSSCM
jgi:alpha-D-ribose 1-methylphosphonate 5-triphosphate synthase subunit PhnH